MTRRTMFVRNNGLLEDVPSFTILFSRCVHLGCPVQPNGPVEDDAKQTVAETRHAHADAALRLRLPVPRRPVRHRGQPDGRAAGAGARPLRVLDHRRETSGSATSTRVGEVEGTGANARIYKYGRTSPGVHVDGPEAWLYPIEVPQ